MEAVTAANDLKKLDGQLGHWQLGVSKSQVRRECLQRYFELSYIIPGSRLSVNHLWYVINLMLFV